MLNEDFLTIVRRELTGLKRLADRALAQVSADQLFSSQTPTDNSIAVIMKHVSGNMRSRWTDFLTADGEKPDRDRDAEFRILKEDTRERLFDRWEEGWRILFAALEPLTSADANRIVTIRGEQLSVLQAIGRQLTHYAYHVGQIVYLAKHWSGSGWNSLSIPPGQSKEFNRDPAKYL